MQINDSFYCCIDIVYIIIIIKIYKIIINNNYKCNIKVKYNCMCLIWQWYVIGLIKNGNKRLFEETLFIQPEDEVVITDLINSTYITYIN